MFKTRTAGILLPISSLAGEYGIGNFGKAAFDFIDFLKSTGFKYWQVLPLGPTGYGDSPYQPFSSFAGSMYYIDLNNLCTQGLLSKQELDKINFGLDKTHCDYGALYRECEPLLRKAYHSFLKQDNIDTCKTFLTQRFTQHIYQQLEMYFLFCSLKHHHNRFWFEEELNIKLKDKHTISQLQKKYKDDIDFYTFVQYLFFTQYFNLKKYANQHGIKIIGDVPFYSSHDSCDCWVNAKNFSLDDTFKPVTVGGCPPDAFTDDGQYWGMPTYNWEYLQKTNYEYLLDRLEYNLLLYDVIRLDHFRGFESYWSIDATEKTARNGRWEKSGQYDFFSAIKKRLPNAVIIAEDLGVITEEVQALKTFSAYPGMKVLQFAFSENGKNTYLPHNFTNTNSVMYTGTHDNATLAEWYSSENEQTLTFACQYLQANNKDDFIERCIRLVLASTSILAIIPAQDFLHLDKFARINTPGTTGNWTWRLTEEDMAKLNTLQAHISSLLDMYNRK